jgi:hypothetical protein
MALVDVVAERIVEVVRVGASRIAVCAVFRVSCEGWLKIELLKSFCELFGHSETNGVLSESDHFDLVVKSDGQTARIELKTFPTNYGRSGKPIANFIDGVIRDLSKLCAHSGPTSIGLVVWMAYPIPEPLPKHWPEHLSKVQAASASTLRSERIPIWEGNFAHLYIMRCR